MSIFSEKSKGIRKLTNRQLFWVALSVMSIVTGALGTSTYAWFIASDALTIKNMQIKLKNSKGLSIGFKKDGNITYFDTVDEETILTSSDNAKIEHKLRPVSGMYEDLWLNEETNKHDALPSFRRQYPNKNCDFKKSYRANSGYIQFETYIKSEEAVVVVLDKEKFKVKADHEANMAHAEKKYGVDRAEEMVKKLDAIDNCVRVSFLTDDKYMIYEPNVKKSSKTKLGGLLDLNPHDGYYDSFNGKEILFGEYNSDDYIKYGEVLTESIDKPQIWDCFNSGHEIGVKPIDFEKSLESGLKIKEEKTYTLDELSIGNNDYFIPETVTPLFELNARESKRVVISMYIEGWDLDCTNQIEDALFDVTFAFTALELPSYLVNETKQNKKIKKVYTNK